MNSNNIAIKTENLSKCYRIGLKEEMHESFAAAIFDFVKSPLKNYRKYRSLYRFDDIQPKRAGNPDDEAADIIWALRDVSFEVEKGEVLGIIGRNGAGKSTLLKILTKITDPTGGLAEIKGRVSSLLEVGTGFHEELTGRENVYLNGTVLGMTKKEVDRKFDDIVDFSGVGKFIDTPVKRYSSGMKVRLAFSVAAHLEPEILLVDEVLAVGDLAFQKKCLGKLGEVVKEGRTVLFVSHNMRAISNLTQSCIWIESGRIKARGRTDRVISQYISSLTEATSNRGLAYISESQRHKSITLDRGRFDWVRLLNRKETQTETFLEGEPIIIELGFRLTQPVESLQFGCSIVTADGGAKLFTVPSPEFVAHKDPGSYSIRLIIDPNHLRHGDYTLGIKMFAGGQRQDTIGEFMKLSIEPFLTADDNPAYMHRWVAGHMRFDYEWSSIQRKEISPLSASGFE